VLASEGKSTDDSTNAKIEQLKADHNEQLRRTYGVVRMAASRANAKIEKYRAEVDAGRLEPGKRANQAAVAAAEGQMADKRAQRIREAHRRYNEATSTDKVEPGQRRFMAQAELAKAHLADE
jgi:hypothetical protein